MNTNIAIEQNELTGLDTIKQKQRAAWEDGNYANFAKFMEAGAIEVLEGWDIANDKTLLDIACGSGQTAIPAAKKGINVTGIDIAENLIQIARERAAHAKLTAQFDHGDAEDLPYPSNTFDVAISMFGAMFAPRPEKVSEEFARIIKPGGSLYMANWTPTSMPAQMFRCVAAFVPPPAGLPSPAAWGDENIVLERLGKNFTDITLTRRIYPQWQYPFNTSELVNLFREYFGPVKRAFETVDHDQQEHLFNHLETIYRENSELHNGILTITGGEFLEVVATRR